MKKSNQILNESIVKLWVPYAIALIAWYFWASVHRVFPPFYFDRPVNCDPSRDGFCDGMTVRWDYMLYGIVFYTVVAYVLALVTYTLVHKK